MENEINSNDKTCIIIETFYENNNNNIENNLFACTSCDYQSKHKSYLKRHLAYKHNIGVEWFPCTELNCDYKFKEKSHLKRHLATKKKQTCGLFNKSINYNFFIIIN